MIIALLTALFVGYFTHRLTLKYILRDNALDIESMSLSVVKQNSIRENLLRAREQLEVTNTLIRKINGI